MDEDYYNKDVQPSDEEYEQTKPVQQKLKDGESPTKLPDDIFGSPSKVPKKYIKLVERLMNSRYVNQTTPPITSMIDASGAGKIQAQAAEVLSMIGPKDWGFKGNPYNFISSVKLLGDHTWEMIH